MTKPVKPKYWTAESTKAYREQLRKDALEKLGGVCAHCKCSDPEVLNVDHIYGCSKLERKEISNLRMYHLILDGTPGYQCLCSNCNLKKRLKQENQGYRKQDMYDPCVDSLGRYVTGEADAENIFVLSHYVALKKKGLFSQLTQSENP